jgi:glycosyltransferase involved in cell wall biosynthesis
MMNYLLPGGTNILYAKYGSDMSPKVSVLIPTFNYAHFLDETIQSALGQTFTDFELLIVDNCSDDDTATVVAAYLGDARVSYHRNEKNLGLVGNWNRCLELANGEYIKFLCADDKFEKTMLEKYVEVMDGDPGISLITCDKQAFGSKNHETITPVTYKQPGHKSVLDMLFNNYCWIGEPTSVMFRRKDLSVGKFSEDYIQYVDWEYWIRLLAIGDCYVVPEKLAYVRFHPKTNSKQLKKRRFVLCFEEYRLCKAVQEGHYGIDTRGSNIDEAVRRRAAFCIKQGMLKTIPELYRKDSRKAFAKAFRIAWEENLFKTTFTELFHGIKRKTQRQLAN